MARCTTETCRLEAWGTTQYCILHDPSPDKDRRLFFEEIERRIPRLQSACVDQPVDLRYGIFPDWCNFGYPYTRFTHKVDLVGAKFFCHVNFWEAQFDAELNCSSTLFGGNTVFTKATFRDKAYFLEATFKGSNDFGSIKFDSINVEGEADFSGATFEQNAMFVMPTVRGQLRFVLTRFLGKPDTLAFMYADLQRPEAAVFEHVDLSRAVLIGTDMKQVRLLGITWQENTLVKASGSLLKRMWKQLVPEQRLLIYDHRRLLGKGERPSNESENPNEGGQTNGKSEIPKEGRPSGESENPGQMLRDRVELLYRQLRINLEASKQEVEAGQFYIGEMEMRRLNPAGSLWGPKLVMNVYRWLSNYGESYWRPLFWYLAFGFLFALGYIFLGGMQAFNRTVSYQFGVPGDFGPLALDFLMMWFRGSLMAGFPLGQDFHPASNVTAILQAANLVLNAVFIASLVLALRRRFRR